MSSIQTDAHTGDPRLRGRTYAIPFDTVWHACLGLAARARGWTVVSADDKAGRIHIEAVSPVLRQVDDLVLEIGLDEDAQTRVDVRGQTRDGKRDLGRKTRTIGSFLRRLDRALQARGDQILDPTARDSWSS